jgi:hypothetical protein
MDHYVGIDVSLEQSSVCVVDTGGRIVREAKVASEPDALVQFLKGLGLPLARVGLEAGPLSQWLYAGLVPLRSRRRDAGSGEAESSAVERPSGRITQLRWARRIL